MPAPHQTNRLSCDQELGVALETVNSFAGWVANVDTKIATLSAIEIALALFMAAQPISGTVRVDTAPGWIGLVSVGAFAASFLASVRHLGSALYPRLTIGPGLNHFVFPSVAQVNATQLGKTSADMLLDQAWAQAHVLSVIALTRFRHFTRALSWAGVSIVSVLAWLVAVG